jgi:hypothetical protein
MDTARQIAGALAPYAVEIVVTFVIPFVGVAVTRWLKAKTSAERQALIAQAAAVAYWVAEQVERKAPDGTPVDKLAEAIKIFAAQLGRDLRPDDLIKAEAALRAIHEERRAGSILLDNKQILQ